MEYHIVIACDAQYSYNGKFVKYSYASGKVVTLTHCERLGGKHEKLEACGRIDRFTLNTKWSTQYAKGLDIYYRRGWVEIGDLRKNLRTRGGCTEPDSLSGTMN